MTDLTTRPLDIDGIGLHTYQFALDSSGGLFGIPALRGGESSTPYQDGAYSYGKRFFAKRQIGLSVVVTGMNAAGGIDPAHSGDPYGQLYANMDVLFGLFADGQEHTLTMTMPDASTRKLQVSLAGTPIDLGDGPVKHTRRVGLVLVAARPLWQGTAISESYNSITGASAELITTGGNAYIGDAVITITCVSAGANPSITIDDSGDSLQVSDSLVASDVVVVDLGTKVYTKNALRFTNKISSNRAWFLRFPPASVDLDLTLDSDSGTFDFDIDGFNKWV